MLASMRLDGNIVIVPCAPFFGAKFAHTLSVLLSRPVPDMEENLHRVLIVDDHPQTRFCLGSMFVPLGWEVFMAGSVAESLELLEEGVSPEFLILDLHLPDGGGEAVLRKVREQEWGTCVLVFTGDPDTRRMLHLRQWKPDLVLFKPLDPEVIRNLCQNYPKTGPQAGAQSHPIVGRLGWR
jgi:DNA-binding response OmpR family regulator